LLLALGLLAAVAGPLLAAGDAAETQPPRERTLEFASADQIRLRGVLVRPPEPPAAGARHPVVILVHAHTRNRDGLLPLADALARAGFAVAVMDQRGHGSSRTTVDESSIYAFPVAPESHVRREVDDQKLLLAELRADPALDARQPAIVGVGVGALVAAEFAGREPSVAALVLVDTADPIAGFEPTRDLGRYGLRPALLVCNGFPQSVVKAQTLAEYGRGERTVACLETFEPVEQMLQPGMPAIDRIAGWLLERAVPAER
jgi:alpha-beta hydrolase superfamily lysophospholipase